MTWKTPLNGPTTGADCSSVEKPLPYLPRKRFHAVPTLRLFPGHTPRRYRDCCSHDSVILAVLGCTMDYAGLQLLSQCQESACVIEASGWSAIPCKPLHRPLPPAQQPDRLQRRAREPHLQVRPALLFATIVAWLASDVNSPATPDREKGYHPHPSRPFSPSRGRRYLNEVLPPMKNPIPQTVGMSELFSVDDGPATFCLR